MDGAVTRECVTGEFKKSRYPSCLFTRIQATRSARHVSSLFSSLPERTSPRSWRISCRLNWLSTFQIRCTSLQALPADEGMTSRHTDNSGENSLFDCHLMRQLVMYFGQVKLWLTKASYTGPHAINSTLSRGPVNLFPDEQTYTDYCCASKRHGPTSQSLSVIMSSSPYLPHGSRAADVPLHRQPNRRGSPDFMLCKRRASSVTRS